MLIKKLKAVLLCVLICIMPLSAACQPTPESAVIAGKGQEYLDDNKDDKQVENNFSDTPGEWKTSFDISKGKVDIDAVVEIPSADKYPIMKVKPYEITNDDLDKFYSVFMPNKTLYKVPDGTKTKQQIQELILQKQRSISDPNSDFNQIREIIGEEAYQSSLIQTQEEIKQFQEELKTAPDTVTYEVSDGHFKEKTAQGPIPTIYISEDGKTKYTPPEARGVSEDNMINVQTDLESEYPATLSAYKFESLKLSYIRFENYGGYFPTTEMQEGRNSVEGYTMSYEEAEELAKRTVEQLGFKEFAIDAGGVRTYYNAAIEHEKGVYTFYFTRVGNGVSVTFTNNQFTSMGTEVPEYFELWDPEYIMVHIDDSGIMGFSWESPTQMIETVTDNAKLLPFDDIQEIFEDQIKIAGAWTDDPSLIERQLKINEVRLGLCRISMRDNPDEYIIVPVWDFFGESHEKYPDDEFTEARYRHSYLTINAIDGSIIDRSLGY